MFATAALRNFDSAYVGLECHSRPRWSKPHDRLCDALPPTFEVGGRQYPDTAILRNALPGPAFRAPALSIPAGLTRDGLPVGFEIDGLPGGDNQLLRLGMAIEAVLEPLPLPTFRNG